MTQEGPQQGSTGIVFTVDLVDKATGAWLALTSADSAELRFKRPTETGLTTVTAAVVNAVGTAPTGTPPRVTYTVPAASLLLSLAGEYSWQAHVTAVGPPAYEYWSDPRKFRVGPNLA